MKPRALLAMFARVFVGAVLTTAAVAWTYKAITDAVEQAWNGAK